MRNYILSVVAAAVICVIAGNLISEKTANGQILKLLCGILMTITALSPLFNIGFEHIEDYLNTVYERCGQSREDSYFDILGHTHKSQFNCMSSFC